MKRIEIHKAIGNGVALEQREGEQWKKLSPRGAEAMLYIYWQREEFNDVRIADAKCCGECGCGNQH